MTDIRRPAWLTPTAVALIAANLVPLYGVVALGWKVFPIVLLFWLENVIVGAFSCLRLLTLAPKDPTLWVVKLFAIPFFTFHYGMFTYIHGVFVFALFGRGLVQHSGFPTPKLVAGVLGDYHLWPAALALVASHGFSYAWNYLGKGEFRRPTIGALMARPYARVFVLHIAIIGGGFLIMLLNTPTAGLVLLVALKIAMDLFAHTKEHAHAAKGAERAAGG